LTGSRYAALGCTIDDVERGSEEWKTIERWVRMREEEEDRKAQEDSCDNKKKTTSRRHGSPPKLISAFRIRRPIEDSAFEGSTLGNVSMLCHGTKKASILGILRRGLLIPKPGQITLFDKGIGSDIVLERTDEGSLGCGIYFASSVSTSLQYSQDGYVFVAEVALGNTQVLTNSNISSGGNNGDDGALPKKFPEAGFDSCMGLASAQQGSQFARDEYSVYRTSQQRLCYLLQFEVYKPPTVERHKDGTIESIVKTQMSQQHPQQQQRQSTYSNTPKPPESSDVAKMQITKRAKIGIRGFDSDGKNSSGRDVTLLRSEYRAKVVDMAAQVTLMQRYINESRTNEIRSARYVFPIDDMAAVTSFEAFLYDEKTQQTKHLVAQVRERRKARREYREAVDRGDGAYMMELVDDEKQDDKTWTIDIGNLPPRTSVVIKISYVTELHLSCGIRSSSSDSKVAEGQTTSSDDLADFIHLYLPLSFRDEHKINNHIKNSTLIFNKSTNDDVGIRVSINMPYDIVSVKSPTHHIKTKTTATKATVELASIEWKEKEGSNSQEDRADSDFVLKIGIVNARVPRLWIEEDPKDPKSRAAMVSIFPTMGHYDSSPRVTPHKRVEYLFVIDNSSSMQGTVDEESLSYLIYINVI